MKLRFRFCGIWLACLSAAKVWSGTVLWVGNSGDFLWQNPANWSDSTVPGANDDVVIAVDHDVTIQSDSSVMIESLQCANHLTLAGGRFQVASGSSVLEGRLIAQNNSTLSATGLGTSFECRGEVDVDGASFEATGGAVLTVPNLVSYAKGSGCAFVSWRAQGEGSVLELAELESVTGASCANLDIEAMGGGRIVLPRLSTIHEGMVSVLADGVNSHVDLPALRESLASSRSVSFEARNGGTVTMPLLPGGTMVTVVIGSEGNLMTEHLTQLAGFTVQGQRLSFPVLTNLTSGNVRISAGAVVALPVLEIHENGPGCVVNNWTATGPGSVLDLGNLTRLAGSGCGSLSVRAMNGGAVWLPELPAVIEGTLQVLADGAESFIDLGGLEESGATMRSVSFESRNGGTLWVPQLDGGPTVTVTLESDGVLPVEQMSRLGGITVVGMAVDFPALTNLHRADLSIRGGAVVRLPNLLAHEQGSACSVNFWNVTGAGSVLDLSAMQRLEGGACGQLSIQAMAGGTLVMDQLPAIAEGTVNFMADGANSLVDLEALGESQATLRRVGFDVRNEGIISAPMLTGGPTVTVAIQSGGTLPVEQFKLLQGLNIRATTLELTGMAQFFSGDLSVSEGAVLRLPGLFEHDQSTGCLVNTWSVRGPGSLLDLGSLTNLVGGSCGWLNIEALGGGRIDLASVTSIDEGTIGILASGPESQIDLRSLREFRSSTGSSGLILTNEGTVWLNPAGTIFSGVEIHVMDINPDLPLTNLAATNLVLYGNPWRSYRVESRNLPDDDWSFYRRVALTNQFQVVGRAPSPGGRFRVEEFIADPAAFELSVISGMGVQPVLYGPIGQSLEVQRTDISREPAVWELVGTISMTNSFRILSLEPFTIPQRYFRIFQP
jgi:hypothetical protein